MEQSNKNDKGRETSHTTQELKEHRSDATSKETLSDLEDSKEDVGSSSSGPDPGPSPDGALDESDEIKDAGPM
jgi:hypothetical protein